MALTATATSVVEEDIKKNLQLREPQVFRSGLDRFIDLYFKFNKNIEQICTMEFLKNQEGLQMTYIPYFQILV
jgi:superfamily II DNA helicase RecQ